MFIKFTKKPYLSNFFFFSLFHFLSILKWFIKSIRVPNAKPGRDSLNYEIYGMEGIPPGDYDNMETPTKKLKTEGEFEGETSPTPPAVPTGSDNTIISSPTAPTTSSTENGSTNPSSTTSETIPAPLPPTLSSPPVINKPPVQTSISAPPVINPTPPMYPPHMMNVPPPMYPPVLGRFPPMNPYMMPHHPTNMWSTPFGVQMVPSPGYPIPPTYFPMMHAPPQPGKSFFYFNLFHIFFIIIFSSFEKNQKKKFFPNALTFVFFF